MAASRRDAPEILYAAHARSTGQVQVHAAPMMGHIPARDQQIVFRNSGSTSEV